MSRDQIAQWDLEKNNVTLAALKLKFDIPKFRQLLLDTRDAELRHYSRGNGNADAFALGGMLMSIRDQLSSS